jgi:D-aminoacyl-tRNA deacylase
MFKKYLIVASKADPAGMNIINQIGQFKPRQFLDFTPNKPFFDLYVIENEIIQTDNLDHDKLNKYDFIIFASKHSSSAEQTKKTLSVHCPGNFRDATMGGIKGKVCRASALFNKFLFQKMNEKIEEHNLKDFEPTMEVTHHGPLIDKPCVFIEIGPTVSEWKNSRAGFVVAKTITETINEYEHNSYREIAVGLGGPHYCPGFNKLQLNSNVAISHIIPGYALPITEEMIKEILNKTIEDYDFVVVDWKGLGGAEARDAVIKILEDNHIQWKKTGDVNR